MAIYHLSIKIISRGKGKSAVAASVYWSGEKIKNEYDVIVHDFTRKGGSRPRWDRWLGWSCNKVAVSEGAAGSPPF